MREFFDEQVAQRAVDRELVQPLSLLSVEDVEILLPYLSDVSLADVLEEYAKYDDPLTTFEIIFGNFRKTRKIESRRKQWIDRRSEEIWQQLKALFVDFSD